MPFCPKCRTRAADNATVCSECGGGLSRSLEPDPNQRELFETVEVYSIPDEITGMAVKLFLTDGGVDVSIQEMQASFYGSVLNPRGGIWGKLLVPKEQEGKARKLLEAFQREFHTR